MSKRKKLSNPSSTGGKGHNFETKVQASFTVLMLTGGYAPYLPYWPIKEIKLQGKVDGYDTDDLVVFIENAGTSERRKLLGQVKLSVAVTKGDKVFAEVMQAAWDDFNNPKVFTKTKDLIALITGPLSGVDASCVPWILSQARHTKSAAEFQRNVTLANFSPSGADVKLEAIEHHLKQANNGKSVAKDELYEFLNHFRWLSCDLDNQEGFILSLLHSHIGQFEKQYPHWLWPRVVDVVRAWNQDAGTITLEKLPEDLHDAFQEKTVAVMPEAFQVTFEKQITDWASIPDATCLALSLLIGSWDETEQADREIVSVLLGIGYDDWLRKAREILHLPGSPLSVKNGVWKVSNRLELWILLASRLLDKDIDTFKNLALTVLSEPDPAFALPANERYMANVRGKVLSHSASIRKGISEGLAILCCHFAACSNCSQDKARVTSLLVVRELFSDADWVRWGSLESLLPALAEASPKEFLASVENALRLDPCPFDELFSQEGKGIAGRNHFTGLLWALEGLAWDSDLLVQVCVVLAELEIHDPGGQWANRPFNSLTTVLLPWYPQTLASFEKQMVAVKTVLQQWPEIGWKLVLSLLPEQHSTSVGSHKPLWRNIIPTDWESRVSIEEYRQRVSDYSQLAVTVADHDPVRLSILIDHLARLPQPAFDQLLSVLSEGTVLDLPDEKKLPMWDQLTKFINRHRRFSDAKWRLPAEIIDRIEETKGRLAPNTLIGIHQPMFSNRDFDLYEENDNWEEQQQKLQAKRDEAVSQIFQQLGLEGVVRFAESVVFPDQVGFALGSIPDVSIDVAILPRLLDEPVDSRRALAASFVWRSFHLKGWEWCDQLDKSHWTPSQIGQFLAWLPFTGEAWERASTRLSRHEAEYWSRTGANPYHAEGDLTYAVEKLLEHGRPNAAIDCLDRMRHAKQPLDNTLCVRALMEALSSNEPSNDMVQYQMVELIQFLQNSPTVSEEVLFKVEWAYLPLLDGHHGATPKLLESKLASDPDFFCEVIRFIFKSRKEEQTKQEITEESRAIARNAWRMLREWKTTPGTMPDGTFSPQVFEAWLNRAIDICTESGHLEVALNQVGEVLIHAPEDPDGMWIHRGIAQALNARELDEMRRGYLIGTFNSRGVHWIDPTGKPERELAERFRSYAEQVENSGYQRFAATLREIASSYDREAEKIIDDHEREVYLDEND